MDPAPFPGRLPGPPGGLPGPSLRADRPVFRVGSLADLLSLVPVVLGFEPHESLVVVAVAGRRPGFSARVDLPPPGDTALAARLGSQVAAVAAAQGTATVAVLAFSADAATDTSLRRVADAVRRAGVEVVAVARSDGARYWSLLCDDPRCCPSGGVAFDPRASAVRAEAAWAGIAVAPGRDAVAARLAACAAPVAARMRVATALAERQVATELGLSHGNVPAGRPVGAAVGVPGRGLARGVQRGVQRGMGRVERVLDRLLDQGAEEPVGVSDSEAAQLSVWCSLVVVRDLAWSRIDRADAARFVAVWSAVSRRVVAPYEPAVLSLAGFAAWVSGDGATAWCAVDRALAADPGYSMARLLEDALARCVPPDVWVPPPRAVVLSALRTRRTPE